MRNENTRKGPYRIVGPRCRWLTVGSKRSSFSNLERHLSNKGMEHIPTQCTASHETRLQDLSRRLLTSLSQNFKVARIQNKEGKKMTFVYTWRLQTCRETPERTSEIGIHRWKAIKLLKQSFWYVSINLRLCQRLKVQKHWHAVCEDNAGYSLTFSTTCILGTQKETGSCENNLQLKETPSSRKFASSSKKLFIFSGELVLFY